MLKAGAKVDQVDNNGSNALTYAAQISQDPRVIEVLIKAGADPNYQNHEHYQRTPLIESASNENPEIAKRLLELGAKAQTIDSVGRSTLWFAAYKNHNPEMLKILLEAGLPVNQADKNGETPLMMAATNNKAAPAFIKVLLLAGADPAAKNKHGQTAWDMAGKGEIKRLLKPFPK